MPKINRLPAGEHVHTIAQIQRLLGCSRSHVERLIASGELEAVDVGNGDKRPAWRIPDRSYQLFVARRRATDGIA